MPISSSATSPYDRVPAGRWASAVIPICSSVSSTRGRGFEIAATHRETDAGNCLPACLRDPEVLGHAELIEDALDLQRAFDAEPADLVRLEAGDVAAAKENTAAVGAKQARNQIEEGGLAGAIRADDRLQPAARQAKAEIVDRGQPAKPPGQIFGSRTGSVMGSVRRCLTAAELPQRSSRSTVEPVAPEPDQSFRRQDHDQDRHRPRRSGNGAPNASRPARG